MMDSALGKEKKNVRNNICNMFIMGIWKAAYLWTKSSLGNIKDNFHHNTSAGNIDWAGYRRLHLHSASDSDSDRNNLID